MDELVRARIRENRLHAREREPTVSVSAAQAYPCSVESLWSLAGSPLKISAAVPMLRSFDLSGEFDDGCPVEEVHTILGWPQRYSGRILRVLPSRAWGMTTWPRGDGPFPLPHKVVYRFSSHSDGASSMRIICRCQPGGLLRLWPLKFIVAWFMQYTLKRILAKVEQDRVRHSATGVC